MEKKKFKTKLELIEELGISKAAFYRHLRRKGVKTTPELLSPMVENQLRTALGFPPLQDIDPEVKQIETD